jgi:hypothetical protein
MPMFYRLPQSSRLVRGLRACLLLLGIVAAATSSARAGDFSIEGTAYEKLDLSSPEAAVRTFISAYRAGDFVTAYWIFTRATQRDWREHFDATDIRQISRVELPSGGQIKIELIKALFPPEKQWEQEEGSFLFASFMQGARRRNILPLDVTGFAPLLTAPPMHKAAPQRADGSVDIAVDLPSYPRPVIFRLERSPLGRWRVRQIIPPGGDETSLPFGITKR